MAWYRFTARHGGGHMGDSEEYVFYDSFDQPGEDEWTTWVDRRGFSNAKGSVEKVDALPTPVVERMRRDYLDRIVNAREMLTLLDRTPTVFRRTYGPDRKLEDPSRCVESIDTNGLWVRQCPEPRGHGADALYCEDHAGVATTQTPR